MNLIQEAHQRLFPQQEFSYLAKLEYNRRLAPFNANIRLQRNLLEVNLNLQWKDIEEEIKIGLIQHLLLKILNRNGSRRIGPKTTPNLELYHHFLKQVPLLAPKTQTDPDLALAFNEVNQQFFSQHLEQPNIRWGQKSFRKLASYNFHTNTITVSTLFVEARKEILHYLMYHEMLHQYYQFKYKNGRSSYHTREFKAAEELFPNHKEMEKEITLIIKQKRKKRWSWF